MTNDLNISALLEILHQKKRVAKADAADVAVKLTVDFEELLEQKFDFGEESLWETVAKIAAEAAAEVEKTVADRCEKLGIPREFAPGVTSMGWRGPSMVDDRKMELRRSARSVIEARLKAVARLNEKHTLAAMQKIIQPGMTAHDAQVVIDDFLPLDDLMKPLTYEEVDAMRAKLPRSRRSWHDSDRMESRMQSRAEEPESFDAESLRDDFLRLLS